MMASMAMRFVNAMDMREGVMRHLEELRPSSPRCQDAFALNGIDNATVKQQLLNWATVASVDAVGYTEGPVRFGLTLDFPDDSRASQGDDLRWQVERVAVVV